jgi:hypothetical protein
VKAWSLFPCALTWGFALTARAQTPAQAASSPAATDGANPPLEIVVQSAPRSREPVSERVSAEHAREMAGTEGDPVRAVENLPGVARPTFGNGQLIVWGASPSDTRVDVDGVEIPRLFHGSGLRSTVNGDLIQDLSLSPGAYGAEYGRALGGVLHVRTRALPDTGVHGYASADVLDSSALVSVAASERVRVAGAFRYGWLDRTVPLVTTRDIGEFFSVPRYQDYQMKAELALRSGESLDAVLLGSHDAVTRSVADSDPAHRRAEDLADGFQRVYLHYQRAQGDGSRVDVVPWLGIDDSHSDDRFGQKLARQSEHIWVWGARASQRSIVVEHVALSLGIDMAGASSQLHREGSLTIPAREGDISVFGQPPGDDVNSDDWHTDIIDVAPYAAADLDFGPLTVTPALRLDGYLIEASRQTPRVGQTPAIGRSDLDGKLEPRLSARVRVTAQLSAFASAGFYSQPPAAADLSAVFGTPSLGPSTAKHVALGQSLSVTKALSLETTGFYGRSAQIAVRDPSLTPKLAANLLQTGEGRSYGIQWLLKLGPWRDFFGWAAYTLSRSERRVAQSAPWRLFDSDQTHLLTLVANQSLGNWTLGARVRYARGLPRTPVSGALYDLRDDAFQPIFGAQNSIRLPDFWQLDLRVDRRFALTPSVSLSAYAELLNATNHGNGEEFAYSTNYQRRGLITGLPLLPVVGARIEL